MKDTFDFTSYIRSGRLHEAMFETPFDPNLIQALDSFRDSVVIVGSDEWYQMADIAQEVLNMDDDDLHYFLGGDSGGPSIWDYAKELGITIEYKEDEQEPHHDSDTNAEPKRIGEIISEVLKSKFNK